MAILNEVVFEGERSTKRQTDVIGACFKTQYNGKNYLQINTMGSKNREIKGKVSQTILIDKEMLDKIVEFVKDNF